LKRDFYLPALFLALTLGSGTAVAQNGPFRATPANARPRQAIIREQPKVVVIQQPVYYPQTYYQPAYYPSANYQPAAPGAVYPVAYTVIPAILMSDGSVWANFGYGFEPVSRTCVVNGNGQVILSNGMVLTSPQATPYIPPAPAMPTDSYNNLPSVAAQRSAAAQASCFGRDVRGQYFVVR
jgi:hypothetical protein